MKLDRTLVNDIKKLSGDGSRQDLFKGLNAVRAAKRALSTPDVISGIEPCLREHGRAATSICIAATILDRADRIEPFGQAWAREVISNWKKISSRWTEEAIIDDGLHPTRICEYSKMFIECTTESD